MSTMPQCSRLKQIEALREDERVRSTPPPGAKGTTMRTGLAG
jgi:hypothetical protein